jgi:hypothetical protein
MKPETFYPLQVLVCGECRLVQTADFVNREECFSANYAYFSSCSSTWVTHVENYAREMIAKRNLGPTNRVVEVAANDGYLLRHFKAAGIPCYGIEPTLSTAAAARSLGLDIISDFFGSALARRLLRDRGAADLIAANNVLAHVPDIVDFVAGVEILLHSDGIATFEFPHAMRLLECVYFDTLYHEHFSYLSLHAVVRIFASVGLVVTDIDELTTHGGSLRVFAERISLRTIPSQRVADFLEREKNFGILDDAVYAGFGSKMEEVKNAFLSFLLDLKKKNTTIAAYGAAAKGNTLLNYAGVRSDLLPFVVDRSPGKVGRFLPGSRIPILSENALKERKPKVILILPWNLRHEISQQLEYAREWGAKFAVALPKIEIM